MLIKNSVLYGPFSRNAFYYQLRGLHVSPLPQHSARPLDGYLTCSPVTERLFDNDKFSIREKSNIFVPRAIVAGNQTNWNAKLSGISTVNTRLPVRQVVDTDFPECKTVCGVGKYPTPCRPWNDARP